MGDYYQGDYYQGDPAFPLIAAAGVALGRRAIGGLIKKAGRRGLGIAARKVGTLLGRPAVARTISVAAAGATIGAAIAPRPMIAPAGLPQGLPGFGLPGTMRVDPRAIVPGGRPFMFSEQVPRGYHINKNVQRGRTGPCDYKNVVVRNRSMNVTNARALRRAIRRASGFAKLARRVLSFVSARAPRGKAVFKRKARR